MSASSNKTIPASDTKPDPVDPGEPAPDSETEPSATATATDRDIVATAAAGDIAATTASDRDTDTESATEADDERPSARTESGANPVPKAPARLRARIAQRRTPITFGALAVIAVAAVVAASYLGWQLRQEHAVDAAATEALAAARAYAVTLTSVDSQHLDRDFAAILDGATGEFKDMYSRSSGQLRQLLVDNEATGKGVVLDAGVKSATEDKVEVVLFIDQTVTNTAAPDPRLDRSRVSMTMERIDGRWLAGRVYLP